MKTKLSFLTLAIVVAGSVAGFGQPTLQFTTNIYAVAENAGLAFLTVQRTGDTNAVVSVDYASANGTAIAGSDYTATNGTLTFAAGETNRIIAVPILNDGIIEATYETLAVTLGNPTGGAVLGPRTNATVRITDNDKGLAFESVTYWVREDVGSVFIGVLRNDDGEFPATVEFGTGDGTALGGQDYTPTESGTDFAWGAGAQAHFGSLGVRLEYEQFNVIEDEKLGSISLSFIYTFL